jgi:hypothetical protein
MDTITWNYGGEEIYVQGTWSKGRFFVYDVIDHAGRLYEDDTVYDLCEIEDDINSNY